jgi:hypothetical protein
MAAPSTVAQFEPPRATPHKWLIALAVMLGTTLVEVLDSSIINVALPHPAGIVFRERG